MLTLPLSSGKENDAFSRGYIIYRHAINLCAQILVSFWNKMRNVGGVIKIFFFSSSAKNLKYNLRNTVT
jgi:hypothetical protein